MIAVLLLQLLFLSVTSLKASANTQKKAEQQSLPNDYAHQFHSWAMRLVESPNDEDPYTDAVAYFRAAVRHSPNNALYLNDLGVTEMRMGQYERAMRRFTKGIRLLQYQLQHRKEQLCSEPSCLDEREMRATLIDLQDNLAELREFHTPPTDLTELQLRTMESSGDTISGVAPDDADEYDERSPWYHFGNVDGDLDEGVARRRRHRLRHTVRDMPEVSVDALLQRSRAAGAMAPCADSEYCVDGMDILDTPFVVRQAAAPGFGWNVSRFDVTHLLLPSLPTPLDPSRVNDANSDNSLGHSRVDFYPHNMVDLAQTHPFFETMDSAMRQLLRYFDDSRHSPEVYEEVDASEAGTYIQWNMRENDWRRVIRQMLQAEADGDGSVRASAGIRERAGEADKWGVPRALLDSEWFRCLEDVPDQAGESAGFGVLDEYYQKTHWRMLLIGEAGAGMFNHKDTLRAPAWQIQVAGRKRWHICSSQYDSAMGRAGRVNTFAPDYSQYPEMLQAECYETVVRPGDLVYYPQDYWHQTRSLDTPTISIGSTSLTAASHKLVSAELRRECRVAAAEAGGNGVDATRNGKDDDAPEKDNENGGGRIFVPNPRLCNALDTCAKEWGRIFD